MLQQAWRAWGYQRGAASGRWQPPRSRHRRDPRCAAAAPAPAHHARHPPACRSHAPGRPPARAAERRRQDGHAAVRPARTQRGGAQPGGAGAVCAPLHHHEPDAPQVRAALCVCVGGGGGCGRGFGCAARVACLQSRSQLRHPRPSSSPLKQRPPTPKTPHLPTLQPGARPTRLARSWTLHPTAPACPSSASARSRSTRAT